MSNTLDPVIGTCKECDFKQDINEIPFIDDDYRAMVLSSQIKGRATKKRAWYYLTNIHAAQEDIDDEQYEELKYYSYSAKLSHDEPGAGHNIIGVKKGFWGFE